MISNKAGNLFALLVALAFGLMVYGSYPSTQAVDAAYTDQNRQDMTILISEAQREVDWDSIPRISIGDLE